MTFTRETTIGKKVYTMDNFFRLFHENGKLLSKSDVKRSGITEYEQRTQLLDMQVVAMCLRKLVKDDYLHTYIHAQQTASKYPLGNWQKMPASEKERCYESGIRHACQFLEAGCPEPSYEYENHYAAFEFNYRMFKNL